MGLSRSNAVDGYLHAVKRRLEKASLEIGMDASDECEGRPGAVSSYSGARDSNCI